MATTIIGYLSDIYRAVQRPIPWEREQFIRFFPSSPRSLYAHIEAAGFSPECYRHSWPDLIAGLPSDEWSAIHYVQFSEAEIKTPRVFPIDLDFEGLQKLADLNSINPRHKASVLRNLVQSQIDFNPAIIKSFQFCERVLAILARVGHPMIVIGDSHSRVYRQTIPWGKQTIIPINILCGGGSATGLPRRTSRSGYGAMLGDALGALSAVARVSTSPVPICFNFGQVDIEFVHTYQRIKHQQFVAADGSYESFREATTNNYLDWIATMPPASYFVLGVNPPCLDDDFIKAAYDIQMKVYVEARVADVSDGDDFQCILSKLATLALPDKLQRTRDHRYFNAHLASAAKTRNLQYIDSFDLFLGADGCIDPKYACASDGTAVIVGRRGVDIHVGGKDALAIQAQLARRIFERLVVTRQI
jgi:hypothetical protein